MLARRVRIKTFLLTGMVIFAVLLITTGLLPAGALETRAGDEDDDDEAYNELVLLSQGISDLKTGQGMRGNLTLGSSYVVWTTYKDGRSLVEYMDRSTGEVTTTEIALQALPLRLHGSTLLVDNKIVDLTTGGFVKAKFDFPMGSTDIYDGDIVVSLDVNYPSTPINYDLYLYDMETEEAAPLVEDQYYQSQPSLWGSDLVWMDARHGLMEVYWMDIESLDSRRLTSYESYKTRPFVQGGKVVWTDFRNTRTIAEDPEENLDIYLYNLITMEEVQVTSSTGYQNHARIFGDQIVYNDHRNGNYDVYIFDASAGEEARLTPNDANQIHPQIWEDTVVWLDDRDSAAPGSGIYGLYSCDLGLDTDGDTQPNYLDTDDDNDGYEDSSEIENGTDPLDEMDMPIPTTEPDNLKTAVLIIIIVVLLVVFIAAYVVITQTYSKTRQKKNEAAGEDIEDEDEDDHGRTRPSRRKGRVKTGRVVKDDDYVDDDGGAGDRPRRGKKKIASASGKKKKKR